jgi:hypothetical protein
MFSPDNSVNTAPPGAMRRRRTRLVGEADAGAPPRKRTRITSASFAADAGRKGEARANGVVTNGNARSGLSAATILVMFVDARESDGGD